MKDRANVAMICVTLVAGLGAAAIKYRPAADAVAKRDAAVRKAKGVYLAAVTDADKQLSKDLDALGDKAMEAHNLPAANEIAAIKGQLQNKDDESTDAVGRLYDEAAGKRFRYALSDNTSKTLEFKTDGTIGGESLAFERRWLVAKYAGNVSVIIDGDHGMAVLKAGDTGFTGRWDDHLLFTLTPLP